MYLTDSGGLRPF